MMPPAGDEDTILELLRDGENIDEADPEGIPPLLTAIINNQTNAESLLLDHGVAADQKDAGNLLLKLGAQIDFPLARGITPVQIYPVSIPSPVCIQEQ